MKKVIKVYSTGNPKEAPEILMMVLFITIETNSKVCALSAPEPGSPVPAEAVTAWVDASGATLMFVSLP